MVPENSDLMRHYEEAAARGELEEEYDGLEITLEEARNAGVSFRPTGADDSFKEEYASMRFPRYLLDDAALQVFRCETLGFRV